MKLKTGQKHKKKWCRGKRFSVYAYFFVFALLLQCRAWDEQCVYRYGDDGGQDF